MKKNTVPPTVCQWNKNGETMDPEEISLIGNQEIRQKFIARESEITKVMIDFKAWEQKNGTGIIEVDLEDQNRAMYWPQHKKKIKKTETVKNICDYNVCIKCGSREESDI